MSGELHEIIPIQDTLCSGLAKVERLSGNLLRFWLYVEQSDSGMGPSDNIVVAKIVAPATAVPDAILQMLGAIGSKIAGAVPAIGDMVN